MNKIFSYLSLLFFLLISDLSAFGQRKKLNEAKIKNRLDSLAQKLTAEKGIFERTSNLGYVPSPDKFQRKMNLSAHNEFTIMILRIDTFELDSASGTYIGKLFIGERYLEADYNRKYAAIRDYKIDQDGFYMACKLYYEERSNEFRLNIYPNFVLNICQKGTAPLKGMHFNTSQCSSTDEHWNSLKYLVALDDRHYDNFSKSNIPSEVDAFLKPRLSNVNIVRKEDSAEHTFHIKKSLIRELNLRKQIKCFAVGSLTDNGSESGPNSLRLRYTKYPLSEDFVEGSEYEFKQIRYSEMDKDLLEFRGGQNTEVNKNAIFVTRNPLYKSLVTSFVPDDNFVPDMNLKPYVDIYYLLDNSLQQDKTINAEGKAESYKTDSSVINKQAELTRKPEYNQNVNQKKNLSLLDSNLLAVTSSSNNRFHWIYYDSAIQGKISDDSSSVTLKESVFLRDSYPTKIEDRNIWLKGRIKSHDLEGKGHNIGAALKGETWKLLGSVEITEEKRRFTWLRIQKM